ncbi:hypothetical protein [Chitinimonas sp.]|uniref:hypothetical protein n=1 Tax=Chitinimonas sp. TaxID=1934313 RepID=UPI002F94166D
MRRLYALSAALALTACATKAPPYSPAIANLSKLETMQPAKVGEIKVAQDKLNSIGLRGSSMTSPVGAGYGDYLKDALAQELRLANKLNADASTVISGELLENDVDASGFSTGHGKVSARFTVKKQDQETYNKQKTVESQWESSFAGPIAIPAAMNNYPLLIQRLLAALYDDQDFVAATR